MNKLTTTLFVWNMILSGVVFFLAYDSQYKFDIVDKLATEHEKESKAAVGTLWDNQLKLLKANEQKLFQADQ